MAQHPMKRAARKQPVLGRALRKVTGASAIVRGLQNKPKAVPRTPRVKPSVASTRKRSTNIIAPPGARIDPSRRRRSTRKPALRK